MRKCLSMTILLLLAACATGPDPVGEMRGRAWSQIVDQTDVVALGGPTLRITASTPLFRSTNEMELALLTRAAGEAVAAGAPRFVLTFVNYDEVGLGELLVPDLSVPESGWIGSYADLLEARADLDLDGSLSGPFGYRNMTTVVRLLGEGEDADRPAFASEDTYEALLGGRIERRNIRPRRRLRLPGVAFD